MPNQHPSLHIAPEASIIDALTYLNEHWPKQDGAEHYRYLTFYAIPPNGKTPLEWAVQAVDMEKMAGMELGVLPVQCIAIPVESPLFQNQYQILTTTCDTSGQLSKFFPTYFVAALFEIQSLLQRANIQGYVVGGITRDLLLYQQKRFELTDVDITVEGDALALGDFLVQNSRNFRLIESYPEFGTIKLQYRESLMLDIASTRKEVYHCSGALPDVIERGVPLAEDIIRRDFTINSLAFSINNLGHILDYTNGIEDIEARVIRVLHPVSFYEDPSRILRALKFAIRFNFEIADETLFLLQHFLQFGAFVYKGGGDRIRYEMKAFLQANYQDRFTEEEEAMVGSATCRQRWLQFFLEENCLQLANMELIRKIPSAKCNRVLAITPKISEVQNTLNSLIPIETLESLAFEVYLCFLLGDLEEEERENTFNRLCLNRNKREAIEDFNRLCVKKQFQCIREFSSATEIHQIFHGWPPSAVVATILYIYAEEGEARFKILLDAYKTFKRKWEHLQLELDGNDLINLGIPQGKEIGETLKLLLNAKLSGRVTDRISEIKFVQELMAQKETTTP